MLTRRELINRLFGILLGGLGSGALKATETLGVSRKNYILFSLYESPPRWLFDLLLAPQSTDEVISNPMIGTQFIKKGQDFEIVNKLIDWKNWRVPSLWDELIPTSQGHEVKLGSIFDQSLIIRGCDMNQDGHDVNSMKLEAPALGKISLGGVLADLSNSFFPAIGMAGKEAEKQKSVVSAFRSPNGLRAFAINESLSDVEYIEQLLNPFLDKEDQFKAASSTEKEFFNLLNHYVLKTSNDRKHYKSEIDRLKSLPLSDIIKYFKSSKQKYEKLVSKARTDKSISGVFDHEIRGVKLPITLKLKEGDKYPRVENYLGIYRNDDLIVGDQDLREIFNEATIESIGAQMAMAETVLKYDLSKVILINIDPLVNLKFKSSYHLEDIEHQLDGDMVTFKVKSGVSKNKINEQFALNTDAHNVGSIISLLGFSLYFKIFATCVREFINVLNSEFDEQGKSLFQKSVLHLASEFERIPKKNLCGSDHGWNGHTSTIISGLFNELHVIGNIYVNNIKNEKEGKNDMAGTWGEGAPLPGVDRIMRYNDVVSTIAGFLDIPSPVGGAKLAFMDGKKLVSRVGKPQNIKS